MSKWAQPPLSYNCKVTDFIIDTMILVFNPYIHKFVADSTDMHILSSSVVIQVMFNKETLHYDFHR